MAAEFGDLLARIGLEILPERVIRSYEVPGVATAREHRLGNAVAELPSVVCPVHCIGRAGFAREVRSAGSRRNENFVQIARQRIDPQGDGGVWNINDHLHAFPFEPAASDRGTDINLVLMIGGCDFHGHVGFLGEILSC